MSGKFFFHSETPPLDDGPDGNIDLLNDETFGTGAVEEDWEDEHNQFAEQNTRNLSLGLHGNADKKLDEDELELSNQQLAAAVEELVLNSDQDQDAIDPAIVSLRKESRPGSYDPRLTENLLSPYLGERGDYSHSTPAYSSQSSTSSVFQTDGMRNIWRSTDAEVQDTLMFSKSPTSSLLERQELNEKLKKMLRKNNESPQLEDEAILKAVKATPTGNWPSSNQSQDLLRNMFPHNPAMLRAEDLEREFSPSQLRGPSPTFGISIPKDNDVKADGLDRSLPARSVSPVFGSPSSHALPIGTPPKHVTDMLHQAHKQGLLIRPLMPNQHPLAIQRQMGPAQQGFFMPQGRVPPGGMMRSGRSWQPHMNRPGMNPALAQDIMARMRKPFPLLSGSSPTNMSPIGSPRLVQAPHMIPRPNMGFGGAMMRPGLQGPPPGFRGHRPMPGPFPSRSGFGGPPHPPMYLGPGHLHPEHSRFVRMRRQQNNRSRPYNQNHYGGYHGGHSHRQDGRDSPRESFLMTNREKEWVIKIQMMALQSDRPEIDDYYYQHYIEKRLQEGGLSVDNESSEQKRLITPTKANPDNKKYIPVQFSNSLGKLTVSSVYNPRQIIDVVHAEKEEDTAVEAVDLKVGMNKRLEIYKVIEKCYSLVIEIEDLQSIFDNLDEDADDETKREKEQKITEQTRMLEDCLFVSDSLKQGNAADTISQLLRIRKGKRLTCRVLSILPKDRALTIITVVVRQLPILIKRDLKEDILKELYQPICIVLKEVDSDGLSQISSLLVNSLTSICKDKFGLSLVCMVLSIGHRHTDLQEKASDNGKAWLNFVSCCLSTLVSLAEKGSSSMPMLLETSLGIDMTTVFEDYQNDFKTNEKEKEKISEGIKSMKKIFAQKSKDDQDSEMLGAKRLPSV